MQLLKQVFSDIMKDISGIIFYGFTTSMVIMAFILIFQSYSHASLNNKATASLSEQNSSFMQIKNLDFNQPAEAKTIDHTLPTAENLNDYLTDVLSTDSNVGSFILTSAPEFPEYQQIIILLGSYVDLTPFKMNPQQTIVFAVSSDLESASNYIDNFIVVKNNKYPLEITPDDMFLYHPHFLLSQQSGNLNNTLFIFCREYSLIKELFTGNLSFEFGTTELLNRMIFLQPTDADLIRAKRTISISTGQYVEIQSVKDFLATTKSSGVRTHLTYMLFYIISTLVLTGAMLVNIYRIIRIKTHEYAIHHLYGASKDFIFARMFLFVFAYQLIPFASVVYIFSINKLASILNLSVFGLIMVCLILLITTIAHRRLFNNDQIYLELRRE